MSENRISIVDRGLGLVGTLLPVGSALLAVVVGWADLRGKTDDNARAITRLEAANAEQEAHLVRIDEARSIGLQRLATVEEAVKGLNRRLDTMDGKLDRLLVIRGR